MDGSNSNEQIADSRRPELEAGEAKRRKGSALGESGRESERRVCTCGCARACADLKKNEVVWFCLTFYI